MEWIRGAQVGRGTFGTVNLAIPKSSSKSSSPPMVVKSSDVCNSESLRNEKEVLLALGQDCPQIVTFLGDSTTAENGRRLYNLFLEYAAAGSLADQLPSSPDKRFPELKAREYTNSILRGLDYIHGKGFVHCDVKLQNVLLFADGTAKIADFGLAAERGVKRGGIELRGTPLYMSPEVVAGGEVDAAADVWAVGCAVVEMVTGKPAWSCGRGCGVGELLCRIAASGSVPEVSGIGSEEMKDFVSKCFVKDPRERWTARMLLDHPFVSGFGEAETRSSPRGPFDFPDSEGCFTPDCSSISSSELDVDMVCSGSVLKRVEALAGDPIGLPDWSGFNRWVSIR